MRRFSRRSDERSSERVAGRRALRVWPGASGGGTRSGVLTLLVARRLAVALPTLVVVLLAAWPIVAFVGIAASRIGYPFDLEWMESGVIDHVRVVLSGEPLYREPSLEFTPYIYTPGYYYASALVSSVAGVGYLSL